MQSGSIRLADGGARVADKLASLQREIHKQQQLVKATSLLAADAVVPVNAAPPSPTHARRQSVNTGPRREASRPSFNGHAASRGSVNSHIRGRQVHDGQGEDQHQPSSTSGQQHDQTLRQQAAQPQHRLRDRQQQPGWSDAGRGRADSGRGQGRGRGRGRHSEGHVNM